MNKRKTLVQKFIEHNATKKLAGANKTCLLAVSGGIDSVIMCQLFKAAGYPFAIAHCNFKLRGAESDADQGLVKKLAHDLGVKFFVNEFDTARYAAEKKISIQLAARELRYAWFEEVRRANKFAAIATAHHLNDNIETIIFNLAKGTGIRGLRGIPERQGKIIRPLLFASREEIEAYQKENKIGYREDSSNASDKYTRNKIRHNIIPVLKEINPALEEAFGEKIELFRQIESVYDRKMRLLAKQLFLPRKTEVYIPILKLKKTPDASSVLFEYLKEFGFNADHVADILDNLNDTPGKQFVTATHRIVKDRRFFILSALNEKTETVLLVEVDEKELSNGALTLQFETLSAVDAKVNANKNIAFLDKSKLEFPLLLRPWKAGDYFYPFGMKLKKKKLKKFLTDEKVTANEKEKVQVVVSNQKIVWVVGYRIDERFKVAENTSEIYKIQLMAK